MRTPWYAREKPIQRSIMRLYQAVGCHVYNLSQARASNVSPGLPDLWVVAPHVGAAWWMEVKTTTGKRSEPQERFARECLTTGTGYVVGGLEAAEAQLIRVGLAVRQAGQLTLTPKRMVL